MDATTLIDAFRVDGKVAVVTGAGSGIGRASALALAGAGATVVCADIAKDAAEATLTRSRRPAGRRKPPRSTWPTAPTSTPWPASGSTTRRASTSGATSPASWSKGPFLDAPEEDLDRIMAVNLKGVFFGCQAAGRVMVDQPEGGSIVNASSAAADAPSPNIGATPSARPAWSR